jgi:hypothetical protein
MAKNKETKNGFCPKRDTVIKKLTRAQQTVKRLFFQWQFSFFV